METKTDNAVVEAKRTPRQSGERAVRLLLFLLGAQEEVTQEEIFQAVPGYDSPTLETRRRNFEMDIKSLETSGVQIARRRVNRFALYRASLPGLVVVPEASASDV